MRNELSKIGFKSTEMKIVYHGNRIFMKQDASMFMSSNVNRYESLYVQRWEQPFKIEPPSLEAQFST